MHFQPSKVMKMHFLIEALLITCIPVALMNAVGKDIGKEVNALLEQLNSFPDQFDEKEVPPTFMKHGALHDIPQGIGVYRKGQASSFFSLAISKEAEAVFKFLLEIPSQSEFIEKSKVLREIVNEEIFAYSFMRVILFRNDTKNVELPPIEEILPNSFIPSTAIDAARYLSTKTPKNNGNVITESRDVTSPLGSQLEYFRDDISINSHHWNWHMLNANAWLPNSYELRDRKGELFLYVHRQIIARYDAERFSCNLPPVLPLQDLHMPIPDAYNPKHLRSTAGRDFTGRSTNMTMHDIPSEGVSIRDLDLWAQRIMQAIDAGYIFTAKGERIPLEERNGIDMLGALVESSAISINREYYGNYHNMIHQAIGHINYLSDVDRGGIESSSGVMTYPTVAMRDPVFYHVHKQMDNMCDAYLTKFPPYTEKEMSLPNARIDRIWVAGELSKSKNNLTTFWQNRNISISRGLALNGIDSIQKAEVRHLQHEQFTHNIQVTNTAGLPLPVTVRIFIAPKCDHLGNDLSYNDQRRMFIEMDKYSATIHPGQQVLKRHSFDSSVTMTTSGTFQQLACAPNTPESNWDAEHASHGCGWPDHMLLPKGHTNGSMFTYFVMLTEGSDYKNSDGKTASSYCGLLNKKYPDKKRMTFPFDRMAQNSKFSIKDFATYPNTMATDITIRHKDMLIQPDEIRELCDN